MKCLPKRYEVLGCDFQYLGWKLAVKAGACNPVAEEEETRISGTCIASHLANVVGTLSQM